MPGLGLAQLDGLGNLSLSGDGLGGHGGPGPLVRRDQLTPAAREEQINQPNMKVVGKNYLSLASTSQKEIVALQRIMTVLKSNTQI